MSELEHQFNIIENFLESKIEEIKLRVWCKDCGNKETFTITGNLKDVYAQIESKTHTKGDVSE